MRLGLPQGPERMPISHRSLLSAGIFLAALPLRFAQTAPGAPANNPRPYIDRKFRKLIHAGDKATRGNVLKRRGTRRSASVDRPSSFRYIELRSGGLLPEIKTRPRNQPPRVIFESMRNTP